MSVAKFRTSKNKTHVAAHIEDVDKFVPQCRPQFLWDGERMPDDYEVTCDLCSPSLIGGGVEFLVVSDPNGRGRVLRERS